MTLAQFCRLVLRRLARWHYHLWWLDVVYPFVLSAFLFAAFSYLIYHGEKHRSISAQIEEALIGFSLRIASPRPVLNPHRILTITLKEYDLKKIKNQSYRGYTDATGDEYAKIIAYLVAQKAAYVVVNWMPSPVASATAYDELVKVLGEANPKQKVIFGVYPYWKNFLPESLFKVAHVLESDPCQTSMQLICIYNPRWDDWLIQELSEDLWHEKDSAIGRGLITRNLPRVSPSYLLYLNSTKEFQDYSFSELRDIWFPEGFFADKIIFIGNGLVQQRAGNPEQVARVATVLTPRNQHPRLAGTPYHKFWAQIGQLFIDNDLVGVVPSWLSISLGIALAALIALGLTILGVPTALGFFLCFVTLAPLVNAFLVRFFNIYVPLFDGLYAGTASFILVTFCKLSFESFRSWRLSIQERDDSDMADTKGNFISLISHNLNTPVAKMQGVLGVLAGVPLAPEVQNDLSRAMSLVTHIQLAIRFVLVATAVEDGRLNSEPMHVRAIGRSFEDDLAGALQRLGMSLEMTMAVKNEDLWEMPLHFDRRVLMSVMAAMVVLFLPSGCRKLTGRLGVEEEGDGQSLALGGKCLVFTLSTPTGGLSSVIAQRLAAHERKPIPREMIGASLLEDVAANLLLEVSAVYRGELTFLQQEDYGGGELSLRLYGRQDDA